MSILEYEETCEQCNEKACAVCKHYNKNIRKQNNSEEVITNGYSD